MEFVVEHYTFTLLKFEIKSQSRTRLICLQYPTVLNRDYIGIIQDDPLKRTGQLYGDNFHLAVT